MDSSILIAVSMSAAGYAADMEKCNESKPLSEECLNLELPLIEPIGVSGKK